MLVCMLMQLTGGGPRVALGLGEFDEAVDDILGACALDFASLMLGQFIVS